MDERHVEATVTSTDITVPIMMSVALLGSLITFVAFLFF